MISWDKAQQTAQKLCQDSSADALDFLQVMMNVGYKEVLASLNRQVTELQATATLVIDQRNYQMPPDCLVPKTLVLVNDTQRKPLLDTPSDEQWELRVMRQRTGEPEAFHYRPRLGIGGGIIELDPIPQQAYTLDMTYEATERDLSAVAATGGTIALTPSTTTTSSIS